MTEMFDFAGFWKPWQVELAKKHGLTCEPGWYGFSCSKGWKDLLDRAFTKMKAAGWNSAIHQVKEKFGTLRLYCEQDGRPEIEAIIREAEEESARTCEMCGKPGRARKLSWVRTLCDVCANGAEAYEDDDDEAGVSK
jgi:hypothetical protein